MCKNTLTSPFFFFNDTATTEIYTLSLHDALPISQIILLNILFLCLKLFNHPPDAENPLISNNVANSFAFSRDRKSTRLNSSHGYISYAVFCLKKKITFIILFDHHQYYIYARSNIV